MYTVRASNVFIMSLSKVEAKYPIEYNNGILAIVISMGEIICLHVWGASVHVGGGATVWRPSQRWTIKRFVHNWKIPKREANYNNNLRLNEFSLCAVGDGGRLVFVLRKIMMLVFSFASIKKIPWIWIIIIICDQSTGKDVKI